MRSRLFALAYKMTQSVVDAEDIVQEVFLTIGSMKAGSISNPEAYFVRAVTNRCLKLLGQRKVTIYPGPDLPEPMEDDWRSDAREEDLSYGLLLLLQRLKPLERAVFILRESLGLDYSEIAQILSSKPVNCRQILHRSKEKLRQHSPVNRTSEDTLVELMGAFLLAVTLGDSSSLIARLRDDVTLYADGGGNRPSALQPLTGPISVLKYLTGIYNKWLEGISFSVARLNGEAAVVLYVRDTGLPDSVMLFSFSETRVAAIYIIRNLDKLKGVKNRPLQTLDTGDAGGGQIRNE
jgi:RNA polymerase sigma-70 factor (ECF subfamily)